MTMIGGLLASVIAALTVVPCIYFVLESLRRRFGARVPAPVQARG
jgi:hypothetical protein